ncbi:MAG: FtsX-like permease family protein [Planctomycetia bacterium]|nr:FtsX-like permease family protein [Planctomycetia bacterium]
MNLSDLFGFAFHSLTQHKLRSSLTLLGVILGAFLVIVTISIGQGVQEVIPRLMRRNDQLRQISVQPNGEREKADFVKEPIVGEMSDERRVRLAEAKKRRHRGRAGDLLQPITDERLAELAAIEHVESAIPIIGANVELRLRDIASTVYCVSSTTDNPNIARSLVAGRSISSNGAKEVLIHEFVAYELGFQNEADLSQLLGSTVQLEFNLGGSYLSSLLQSQRGGKQKPSAEEQQTLEEVMRMLPVVAQQLKLTDNLQQLLKKTLTSFAENETVALQSSKVVSTGDLTVVGIYRSSTDEEHRTLHEYFGLNDQAQVPVEVARELARQMPGFDKNGYGQVVVRVDEERHVRSVVEHLRSQKYQFRSLVEIVEHLQREYGLMLWSMTALGTVALLISAIGITNTMLMSVLERTREIGIMKAVGARDGQIQAIFLTEGACIGLVGAAIALVSARGASMFANSWIQQIVSREAHQPVDDQLFLFPWWLIVGIFIATLTVTLLAAWIPARRAARIPPVVALRHD